jgi:hypothetical protein
MRRHLAATRRNRPALSTPAAQESSLQAIFLACTETVAKIAGQGFVRRKGFIATPL